MTSVITKVNQTLFDVCIQESGTVEALFDLMKLNGLTSLEISEGVELRLPRIMKPEVVEYYKKKAKQSGQNPVVVVSAGFMNLPAGNVTINAVNTLSEVISSQSFPFTLEPINMNIPDVAHTDSDGESVVLPANVPMVCSPAPTGWVRPTEWLSLPDFEPSDNRISILFAVYELSRNWESFAATISQATIYWGDGTFDVGNGSYQTKIYDYSSLPGPVNIDEFGRNYKQVIIDIIGLAGFTLVRLGRPGAGVTASPSGWLDMKAQSTTLTTLDILFDREAPYLKKVDISGLTQNAAQSSLVQLAKARNISELSFNPALTGTLNAWMSGNQELFVFGDLVSKTTGANSFFASSAIKTVGNITLDNLSTQVNINNMFDGCRGLREVGNIYVPNSGNNMTQMFRNCSSLTKIGTITLSPNVTSIQEMFLTTNVEEIIFLSSLASVLVAGGTAITSRNLRRLVTPGLRIGLSVINANMSADALNEFFTSLGTASESQTITVTGNPGSSTCDTTIATGKGFTVTT